MYFIIGFPTIKKRLWHRCFPMNFVKLLITSFGIDTIRCATKHLLSLYFSQVNKKTVMKEIKVVGLRNGKKHLVKIVQSLVAVLFKETLYLLCIYQKNMVLSLSKIDTLNITMYILTILKWSLKARHSIA